MGEAAGAGCGPRDWVGAGGVKLAKLDLHPPKIDALARRIVFGYYGLRACYALMAKSIGAARTRFSGGTVG